MGRKMVAGSLFLIPLGIFFIIVGISSYNSGSAQAGIPEIVGGGIGIFFGIWLICQ